MKRTIKKSTVRKAVKTVKAKVKLDLPPLVVAADLLWPDDMAYNVLPGGTTSLTFYKTERFGWCVATLFISRGKRGQPDRTYATSLDTGQTVSIGNGPHVLATVRVHLSKKRIKALQPYLDTYVKGMSNAGEIRDRISSRRAQGQMHRAAGHTSWMWS